MKNKVFDGIIPPLVTPLTAEGEVDVASLKRLTRYTVDGGVDGLWVLGATGQFHTLTERQRSVVTDTVIQEVNGQVPVLIGCIDSGSERCIERAKMAKASGADAIFATTPIYDKVTQVEVFTHFRRIRESVDIPMLAYDASYATQTPMEIATVVELAEEGTLVGIKDSADFSDFPHLLAQLRHIARIQCAYRSYLSGRRRLLYWCRWMRSYAWKPDSIDICENPGGRKTRRLGCGESVSG